MNRTTAEPKQDAPEVDEGIVIVVDGKLFHPNPELARQIRKMADEVGE